MKLSLLSSKFQEATNILWSKYDCIGRLQRDVTKLLSSLLDIQMRP